MLRVFSTYVTAFERQHETHEFAFIFHLEFAAAKFFQEEMLQQIWRIVAQNIQDEGAVFLENVDEIEKEESLF